MKIPFPENKMNKTSYCSASLGTFFAVFILIAGGTISPCHAESPQQGAAVSRSTRIQAVASVGPVHYLSGADVALVNAEGLVIGRSQTNIRGSAMFSLPRAALRHLPFKLMTSGGMVIGQTGNQYHGPAFTGHLRGRINKVAADRSTPVYLDLLSTSASVMQSPTKSYLSAYRAVRAALNIGNGFPVNGVRFQNNHVGWKELEKASIQSGGYDRYVKSMVERIKKRQKITELAPSPYAQRQVSAPVSVLQNALNESAGALSLTPMDTETPTTSPYPQCPPNASVGSGSSNSGLSSIQLIEDFGVLSVQTLLTKAAIPNASQDTTMIAGMLLTGGTSGSAATASALQAVDAQLTCISSQLTYLEEQVNEVELTTIVETATNCESSIQSQYDNYQNLVIGAQPATNGNAAPADQQLTSNNPNLTQWVTPDNGVNWLNYYTCGANIDNMLFTSGTDTPSAWQQLISNYQNTYPWYGQLQVQQLQQFLSYWGTLEYYAFIVTNEYYNYNGQNNGTASNAGALAGNYPGSTNLCVPGTLGSNYCYFQSHILNAYPSDLYSDEIGIWQNGLAVNPFPAGLAITNPLVNPQKPEGDQTGLTPLYIYNTSGNNSTWSANASAAGASNSGNPAWGATNTSYSLFNSYGINPSNQASAVEQFSNPQALRTLQPTSSQVSALQKSSNGVTASLYLLQAINQQADTASGQPAFPIPSGWGSLTSTSNTTNGIGFFTSDNVSSLSTYSQDATDCNAGANECTTTKDVFNNTIGQYVWSYTNPDGDLANPVAPGNFPVFGALLGRTWWPSVTSAISYTPPSPPILTPGSSSILAGTGNNTVPGAITIDSSGNIYTANQSNNVTKITPSGVSSILGSTGNSPNAITVDSSGNVYTANGYSNNVTIITPSGVSSIFGTTGSYPFGITIDSSGNIYTANAGSNNVTKITPAGVSTTLGTTGEYPFSVIVDSSGNAYTANYGSNNVTKITPSGSSSILGTTGSSPNDLVMDSSGNIYVSNLYGNSVTKITPSGASTVFATTGTEPDGIAIDSYGNIYTSNYASNNVSIIYPNGQSSIFGTTAPSPEAIAISPLGWVYTANGGSSNVSMLQPYWP